jgi:hypothetical protein
MAFSPEMNSAKTLPRKASELLGILQEIQSRGDVPEVLERFRDRYQGLPPEEKPALFEAIVRRYEISPLALKGLLTQLASLPPRQDRLWRQGINQLRRQVESPRIRIFRNFGNISAGLKFLLDLRADVMGAQRQSELDLEPLEEDIAQLLNSWFQSGFLFLSEITLDSSYRQILFLKNHDLVHPMASLEEMGDRLGKDRRCFALFHRVMPDEPVVFIEVALTRGMAASIHDIIEKKADSGGQKKTPDTAIFYSINNTQHGLAGLGLGKILIFQVVEALKTSDPAIKTFATLSPIPGFWEKYLRPVLKGEENAFLLKQEALEGFFTRKDQQALFDLQKRFDIPTTPTLAGLLLDILSRPDWMEQSDCRRVLAGPLTKLAYFYLTREKDKRGKPLNPVANFHIGNGATLSPRTIRFAANRSPRGISESCGLMVNYLYSQNWLQQIRRTMQSLLPWRASLAKEG